MKFYLNILCIFIWYIARPTLAIPAYKNISQYLQIKNYNLQYRFDFNSSEFSCTEEINLVLKDGAKIKNEIVLDSEGLNIVAVSLKDPTSSTPISLAFDNSNGYNVTLNLVKPLQPRLIYTISLQFGGKLSTSNTGITIYKQNEKQYISTNFLPFYARQAFPCFNDVTIKSKFTLTITVAGVSNVIALSNMPYEARNEPGTYFKFKETPEMSLHNLFFTVGHYEVGKMGKNIYLPRSNEITLNEEISNILENTEYKTFLKATQMKDVKIVCVPGMHPYTYTGYGIVAIKEDNMYFDLKKVTTEQRKQALLNIFGGFYKLFYGNIVMPGNWSDYWLAESISMYLAYNGLTEISEWSGRKEFIPYDLQQKVLQTNAYSDSPPVVDSSLHTEEDVIQFLNGPAMLKGASILVMLENALTKKVMIDVFTDYLAVKQSGSTVSTKDFVKFISEHQEVIEKIHHILDLSSIINPWLYNSDYPYIQTTRAGSGITIREKSFTGGIQGSRQEDIVWNLPIHYATENTKLNDNNFFWLLLKSNHSVSLNFTVPQNQWFVLNANGTGPYRVNYENSDWKNIGATILADFKKLSPSSRAQLISDSFAFLYSGQANFTTIFTFLNYLEEEEDVTPWLSALDQFTYLRSLLYKSDLNADLNDYMIYILSPIYIKLGIDKQNENNFEGPLRQRIVKAMCDHGNQGCLQDTVIDYKKIKNQQSDYAPNNDVRPIIICNGIRDQNDAKAWMKEFNDTFNSIIPLGKAIRKVYYEALACPATEDKISNAGIDKFLEIIFLEKSVIRLEDVPMAFKAIYSNPEHVTNALSYFLYNEYILRKDITTEIKIQLLQEIAPYLTLNQQRDLLTEFVNKTKPSKEIRVAVKQTLDHLTKTQVFLEKNKEAIRTALHSKDVTPSPTATPTTTITTSKSPTTGTTGTGTTGTGTTGTGTGTTGTGTTPSTPTKKPNSASFLTAFNFFTLAIFYLGLHLIK